MGPSSIFSLNKKKTEVKHSYFSLFFVFIFLSFQGGQFSNSYYSPLSKKAKIKDISITPDPYQAYDDDSIGLAEDIKILVTLDDPDNQIDKIEARVIIRSLTKQLLAEAVKDACSNPYCLIWTINREEKGFANLVGDLKYYGETEVGEVQYFGILPVSDIDFYGSGGIQRLDFEIEVLNAKGKRQDKEQRELITSSTNVDLEPVFPGVGDIVGREPAFEWKGDNNNSSGYGTTYKIKLVACKNASLTGFFCKEVEVYRTTHVLNSGDLGKLSKGDWWWALRVYSITPQFIWTDTDLIYQSRSNYFQVENDAANEIPIASSADSNSANQTAPENGNNDQSETASTGEGITFIIQNHYVSSICYLVYRPTQDPNASWSQLKFNPGLPPQQSKTIPTDLAPDMYSFALYDCNGQSVYEEFRVNVSSSYTLYPIPTDGSISPIVNEKEDQMTIIIKETLLTKVLQNSVALINDEADGQLEIHGVPEVSFRDGAINVRGRFSGSNLPSGEGYLKIYLSNDSDGELQVSLDEISINGISLPEIQQLQDQVNDVLRDAFSTAIFNNGIYDITIRDGVLILETAPLCESAEEGSQAIVQLQSEAGCIPNSMMEDFLSSLDRILED